MIQENIGSQGAHAEVSNAVYYAGNRQPHQPGAFSGSSTADIVGNIQFDSFDNFSQEQMQMQENPGWFN